MQRKIVGQFSRGAEPHHLPRRALGRLEEFHRLDMAHLDRAGPREPFAVFFGNLRHGLGAHLGFGGKRFRIGRVRHLELMLEALFRNLKRSRQCENLVTVLDRNDAPRGETRAIAAAVHLVEDRHFGIARAQEISVQRMTDAVLHRAVGRHKGLPQHLPAEHALHPVLRRNAAKDVDLDGFQTEQIQDFINGCRGRCAHVAPIKARFPGAQGKPLAV